MCGIAGHFCFSDARPQVDTIRDLLVAQEARGRSAAGVGYANTHGMRIIKGPVTASTLAHSIDKSGEWDDIVKSPYSLLHARATTKGSESHNENNHPVQYKSWCVVHNGHVANDDDLAAQYGGDRGAEVDTVAIAMALAQGSTIEESLSHLSALAGAATFAAYNTEGDGEVILARLNGPPAFLHLDARNRILYWSSDNTGIFGTALAGVGGLAYTNVSLLPDRAALVLSPNGRVARFEVPRRPFFRPKLPRPVASTQGSSDGRTTAGTRESGVSAIRRSLGRIRGSLQQTEPATVDQVESTRFYEWLREPMLHSVFRPSGELQAESREDYVRLGKPEPDFSEGRAVLSYGMPPLEDFVLRSAYGTWKKKDGYLEFKPAKRLRGYFNVEVAGPLGMEVKLPADIALQEALEGTMRMENVQLQYQGITTHVALCPWCGIMATTGSWTESGGVCKWCRVKSFRG